MAGNIYSQKQVWKIILMVAALLIVVTSLLYTRYLVKKISTEERAKVRLWAEAIQKKAELVKKSGTLFAELGLEEKKKLELITDATKILAESDFRKDYTFLSNVVKSNENIPVILTDEKGEFVSQRNLDPNFGNPELASIKNYVDSTYLALPSFFLGSLSGIRKSVKKEWEASKKEFIDEQLAIMKATNPPIVLNYYQDLTHYYYYKDSRITEQLKKTFSDLEQSFISEVVTNSASAPVVMTDESRKNVIAFGHFDEEKLNDSTYLEETLLRMEAENLPIEIELGNGIKRLIFYEDSFLLTQLKYYPVFQFGIIGLFMLVAYLMFSTARRAEQNQVWVGMSKETAHQLGTPLSSLMAWMEILKDQGVDTSMVNEMGKDIKRLETITDRFSKIGSVPNLQPENIIQVLNTAVRYIQTRTSSKVKFSVKSLANEKIMVAINIPLFEWVIENLCKNAIDAMDGAGSIDIEVSRKGQQVIVDISDTGKGIPSSKIKTVFQPGYTTKKRGWGLGLSLVKRIIDNYHSGKIFVKKSEVNQGTTFRIILKA